MEILKTENLTFTYAGKKQPTIKNVSVNVNSGEFITICGATGSGKSTFLKLLKKEILPLGEKSGDVFFEGESLNTISDLKSASHIGYVMQRTEQQIVTDKVWHELAFGLENINVPKNVISRKIAEMASYFGIEDWFDKSVDTLSGGQKQMLNLASVMVMNPKLLILDEPTSQLDPIASSEFLSTLKKINRDLGVTVIIAEHNLEELLTFSDKLMFFNEGEVLFFDSPENVIQKISESSPFINYLPTPARIYKLSKINGKCPLTVREGRKFIQQNFKNNDSDLFIKDINPSKTKDVVLEFKNVYFRYSRDLPDVLRDLNLKIFRNEIFCILGGNGSGKSTLFSVASKLEKPYSGHVKVEGKKLKEYTNQSLYKNCIAFLPQDVQSVFLSDSVSEEISEESISRFDLESLKDMHPYDLSGGEQQQVAIAKVLECNPQILLLDEPTKGIDKASILKVIEIIKDLKKSGKTVVIVTHDLEFAANVADRCALLFRGNIQSVDNSKDFFCENNFYTTVENKMTRDFLSGIVTFDDLMKTFLKNKGEF